MKRLYASYEAEHLRAYWDSTLAFPVSITKRRASRYLDAFFTDRKQRRSRAGARWMSFFQQVLIGLLRGYCDLDQLSDPFFLHFPRHGEAGAWYPGIEYGADPADLLEALTITDAVDRWRNHYRDVPEEHPALEIARLRGKFLSSSA
ncbi:Transcription initiation factor TFIID subunit 10 [Phytophthora nicotianae]|uniref:Transcription initiation factor TFIID subunit 10 n=1 Tax=Phytophthora nicotianae TaxID=4792 RepID=A0A0W8CEG3_PHYNI|nr:Transcription initiation factor TFIID subunit 10 [Phytophthora nicotianae]